MVELSQTKTVPALSLRPREAAAAIGVSPRTLWGLTAAGKVPHVRLGRAILYPVPGLQDWLSSKSSSAPKAG